MTGFVDQYLDGRVAGYPCISAPRTSTSITATAGGAERRNRNWVHPLHDFILPEALARGWDCYEALHDHWMAMGGPEKSWPWRDPMDFASRHLDQPNVAPAVTMLDQQIGVADGATASWQLTKTYTVGSQTYTRNIHLPVTASLLVSVNGVLATVAPAPGPFTVAVTRPGGVVTLNHNPTAGHVIRAGFLFDVEVRFESDDAYEGILRAYQAGGFAELKLREVRPC